MTRLLLLFVSDIDECGLIDVIYCANPLELCINTLGSFHCECQEGFQRSNNVCEGSFIYDCILFASFFFNFWHPLAGNHDYFHRRQGHVIGFCRGRILSFWRNLRLLLQKFHTDDVAIQEIRNESLIGCNL